MRSPIRIIPASGMSRVAADARYVKKHGYDDIGIPGTQGYGVSIRENLPDGFTQMEGSEIKGHDNWGNYQFQDGSVCVYVGPHYFKIGNGVNGLPVNRFISTPITAFSSEANANLAGYFLSRACVDGGVRGIGYFVDKYQCSKNAYGTGYIASSIKNGNPISTASTHNPIADLTACIGNYYHEAINAAHARDGVNGEINSNSNWFCASRFIYVDLAMLSMAHGQAATSTTYCAWYDATGVTNYPKGCNNNALGDTDDGTVSYTSDGYSNCGKTGSGSPFAKTTHNGQNCGIADLNGNIYEINLGVTCVATTKTITSATQANPCQLTISAHGITTGQPVMITSVGGMAEINDKIFTATVVDVDNITLDGVDSTAFAAYTSGGSCVFGNFYAADEATAMKDFTSGNSGTTDHWGAVGVAAMMTEFMPVFEAGYPSNGFAQRMGSGANQVLSEAVNGNGAELRMVGMPKDADGVDTVGTNQFGKDYFYQYIQNELCVRSGLAWGSGSLAGVWGASWGGSRSGSGSAVGFRCACYPV